MSFMLTLADISGETWSEDVTVTPKVLGRSEVAEIRLDHSSVSRQHCKFWMESDVCYVEDCGSTNGTFVNGVRIKRKEKLNSGDTVLVGRFELIVADRERILATVDMPDQPSHPLIFTDTRGEDQHLASVIHERLTPSRRMTLPGLLVDIVYHPSGKLGGDCFESFELNNRWVLSVFDPMSHGIKAALTSILLRSELHRWVALTAEPARCLQWINAELTALGINDLYISATVASWFPRTNTLVYSTAGEHPPLILREGKILNLGEAAGGMPLGVQANEAYIEHLEQLKPGDRFFLFTDGIAEALYPEGTVGAPVENVARLIEETAAAALQHQVHDLVDRRPTTINDDLLLVGCEITPS